MFEEDLQKIIENYNDCNEPLDGDGADILVEHLRNSLNLMQGNITHEEYLGLEKGIKNG